MLRLKDKLIFIVEDNPQNRVLFQMALVRHGAHLEFERWGQETVFRLQGFDKVHVILLDLMLANGVSGFEVCTQIRNAPKFARVPIVAVSAMDPAVAMPKARERDFSGFIAKPIAANRFADQIVRIIQGEQIWDVGEDTF